MLTLNNYLPLEAPAKAANLNLEVFDPEFFIDFELAESDPVKLAGAPSALQARHHPAAGSFGTAAKPAPE